MKELNKKNCLLSIYQTTQVFDFILNLCKMSVEGATLLLLIRYDDELKRQDLITHRFLP